MQNSRYLSKHVHEWLKKRMVFIGGPRQVGKTFLSKSFINDSQAYLNWDHPEDRKLIKSHKFPDKKLLVLDEIHKYPKWRNLIKGIYDKKREELNFLITGSARLDLFKKGGDSLFGRYHYFRLHPFSLPEAINYKIKDPLARLMTFGGFPEPLFENDPRFLKNWQLERKARVIHQDLRDLTVLRDYTDLELLADMLPEKVGSLLSFNSIAEDLEKSPHTISRWIEILESIYYCYTILPYSKNKLRAVKKSRKLYLWDWSEIQDPGARFENFVASHLLKYCHFIEDTEGDRMELRFLRDNYGKEIDFLVLKNKVPLFAVECKLKAQKKPQNISGYFSQKISIPKFYQVHLGTENWSNKWIHVIPFDEFCKIENLV